MRIRLEEKRLCHGPWSNNVLVQCIVSTMPSVGSIPSRCSCKLLKAPRKQRQVRLGRRPKHHVRVLLPEPTQADNISDGSTPQISKGHLFADLVVLTRFVHTWIVSSFAYFDIALNYPVPVAHSGSGTITRGSGIKPNFGRPSCIVMLPSAANKNAAGPRDVSVESGTGTWKVAV